MKTHQLEMDVSLVYEASRQINFDDENYVLTVSGSVYGEVEHASDPELKLLLGELKMFLVLIGNAFDDGQLFSVVLDAQQQTLDIGCVLFDDSFEDCSAAVKRRFEDASPYDDILILDRLTLDPAVRGQSIGLAVLDQAIRDWSGGCSLVAMKPFPLQFEGGKPNKEKIIELKLQEFKAGEAESFRRLRNYYAKLGFKRIARSDVYALCTDYSRPALKDLSLPDNFTIPAEFVESYLEKSKK